ncbi:MAG: Gfo/Idh/MocA family oxidoreductase [Candidatus Poribacteria bacterium]|nr:Gfo/Idh/MocA family oxidoreductase [Candidatus Poribacteria bacterium]
MGISVGIVGLGQFGPAFIKSYKDHPDVSRLALCDLHPDLVARYAKQYEITETYASLDEACRSDLDALVLITQPWLHADQAVQVMEAGKHVYTAVPASYTLEGCARLVETVERTGLVYMNGETSYFRPDNAYCRQKAQEGAFGEFVYGEGQYFHDISHGLYEVSRKRWGDQWDMSKSGGIPMSYPTHSTCFMVSVMGARMTSVSCIGYKFPNDDWFRKDTNTGCEFSNEVGLFEMSNGASARIAEFRRVGYPGSERINAIYGTEGSFEQNAAGAVWTTLNGVEPAEMTRHHEWLPEPLASDLGGHGGSHAYLVHEFVDSVNKERLPRINVWEAVKYAAPGLVAHESALRDGERLPIPDFGDPPSN